MLNMHLGHSTGANNSSLEAFDVESLITEGNI